ncbi:MAG TPA: SGNH/GDSL hydrolase family protein [Gemmatimonadaceae bacterium]|nr:SGNH/GDSL hydrolase family protein [Gemmatimonadaceae bacterium]
MRHSRPVVRTILSTAIAGAVSCTSASTSASPAVAPSARWLPTWAPSQSATAARPAAGTRDPVPTYANTTIRQIIHTTIGGDRLRIRISNEYGDRPLKIGAAHVALRTSGSTIDPATDRSIMFDGKTWAIVRAGAVLTSDALSFPVPKLGDLAISIYLPDSARTSTRHALGVATTYVSRAGDQAKSPAFTADTTLRSWIFLSGVDVVNPAVGATIVATGNSITDGFGATPDSNRRWPDILARRLLSSTEAPKAVVNAGISGNRVLTFGAGPSLLSRFDRDVLMQAGVTHVIILEGINDISRSAVDTVSAEDITYGLRQVVERAHERGIVVYGATLTPFERARPENEAKRQAVNQWIRTSGVYDGVIDFDAVVRDPAKPDRMLPAYDSGDALHPSDAGYLAMANAIDLALFRRRRN